MVQFQKQAQNVDN